MKNLKKVLAFVTMFTMLLSVAVSAGTLYADVADNASYAEAVATLNALGIMIGDDQGNFNPEASITRAETAAVVTRMKALGEAASAAGGTKFNDVAADHWAAGYINLAEQSGIINGYGDGNFGPEDEVKYEQVIKMIVAALGYTPEADMKGGYPTGYNIIAARENITKGVSVTPGVGAPRAAVARMVFNALEVELMDMVNFNPKEPEYKKVAGSSLLKDALKVTKYEGTVTNTYNAKSGATLDEIEDGLIWINIETENGKAYTGESKIKAFAEGDTNAADLFANRVVFYVSDEEEVEAGEASTLLGIAKKANKNSELVLNHAQIKAYTAADQTDPDAENWTAGAIEYLETEDATRTEDLVIAADVEYVYNGKVEEGTTNVTDFLDDAADGTAGVIGSVKLLDNDGDEAYDFIFFMEATGNYLVGEIDAEEMLVKDENKNDIGLVLDEKDIIVNFYKADGTPAEFADVKVGDALTLYMSEDEKLVAVYISDAKVEGVVTEQIPSKDGDHTFVIGGEEYKVAFVNKSAVETVGVNNEGIFYLNHDGRIFKKDAVTVAGNYAYLLNAMLTEDINGQSVEIKYVNVEGKVEVAVLAEDVYAVVDDAAEVEVAAKSIANEFAPLFEVKTVDGKKKAVPGKASERMFQFAKDSSGKINRLFIATTEKTDKNGEFFNMQIVPGGNEEYDGQRNRLGSSMYFNDETPIFSIGVAADATDVLEKNVTLTKVSDFFTDGEDISYDVIGYDPENKIPAIVAVYGATSKAMESSKGVLITRISDIVNANGDKVKKVYGFQNGVEVVAETASTTFKGYAFGGSEESKDDIKEGDFVLFGIDAAGVISDTQILIAAADAEKAIADANKGNANALIGAKEGVGESTDLAFGFAQEKDGNYLNVAKTWKADAELLNKDGYEVNVNGVSIYEVNLLRDPDAYSVSKYTSIKTQTRPSTATNDRVSNWVFVRVYDEEVIDVVVYTAINPIVAE